MVGYFQSNLSEPSFSSQGLDLVEFFIKTQSAIQIPEQLKYLTLEGSDILKKRKNGGKKRKLQA